MVNQSTCLLDGRLIVLLALTHEVLLDVVDTCNELLVIEVSS
jgi:hypothetical protein